MIPVAIFERQKKPYMIKEKQYKLLSFTLSLFTVMRLINPSILQK